MIIIIPMAGLSSRFSKAGYMLPKYMLPINNATLFDYSVSSFKYYFNQTKFLFVARELGQTRKFISESCAKLGLVNFDIIMLDEMTRGQAETVAIGLETINATGDTPILIFNIDTFRPNFVLPKHLLLNGLDGYLEVFEGEGEHWSFVEPIDGSEYRVKRTTEKERISNLCSTGLYYFNSSRMYLRYFNQYKERNIESPSSAREYYIAPMYNLFIDDNLDIRYDIIKNNQVAHFGTPAEYESANARFPCVGDSELTK